MQARAFTENLRNESSATGSITVTPHDTNELSEVIRALVVFSAGSVKFTCLDGTVDTWTLPEVGLPYILPIAIRKVWATGTTPDMVLKGLL